MKDPYIREKFTRERSAARKLATADCRVILLTVKAARADRFTIAANYPYSPNSVSEPKAPPLQGRTNKTAALDPAPTDPLWPAPAADRVNVRESLFAEAFNRLLQQNLP
jgi:hypothetical protein